MDEDEDGGLRGLAEVLLGYGERHFDGPPGQPTSRRGVWASVLLMCGQFERVYFHLPVIVSERNSLVHCRPLRRSGNIKILRSKLFILLSL